MPQSYTLEELQKSGATPLHEPAAPPNKAYSLEELTKLGATPHVEQAEAPALPSQELDETGAWAGFKRGIGNIASSLNPFNYLQPQAPPTDPTQVQENIGAFQHALEHPVATAISGIPIVGPALAGLAERAPQDPLGTAVEAATTIGIPAMTGIAFPALREFTTRKVTAPRLNALMEVSPAEIMTGRNPGARVIGEKIIATSHDDLLNQMQAKKADWGQQLESKLATQGRDKVIDGSAVVKDAFYATKRRIGIGSDPALQRRLLIVYKDINNYVADQLGASSLSRLTPLQAQRLKSFVGQSIKWGQNIEHEAGINETLANIYRGLNSAVESKVPGTKALLGQYGDFEVGTNALRNVIAKQQAGQATKGHAITRTIAGRAMYSPAPEPAPPPSFSAAVAEQEQTAPVRKVRALTGNAADYIRKKVQR